LEWNQRARTLERYHQARGKVYLKSADFSTSNNFPENTKVIKPIPENHPSYF